MSSIGESMERRAEEFVREVEAAQPKQLDELLRFASRAFRRPLQGDEESHLRRLYADHGGTGKPRVAAPVMGSTVEASQPK